MCASLSSADLSGRLVLFPQGNLVKETDQQNAAKMLVKCGGDPLRFIDHAYNTLTVDDALERYIRYINRLKREALQRAIVLLKKTECVPFGIIKPRMTLMNALPSLRRALWCIYVDTQRDPLVINNFLTVGKLYGLKGKEQVFVDYREYQYLLLRAEADEVLINSLSENAKLILENTSHLSSYEAQTDKEEQTSHVLKPRSRSLPARSYSALKQDERALEETGYSYSLYPAKRRA